MRIKFKIFGFSTLRQVFGGSEINLEFNGKTVDDLVKYLIAVFGHAVEKTILQNDGQIKHGIRFLRNGHQWIDSDNIETRLKDGDILVLSLLVAGG